MADEQIAAQKAVTIAYTVKNDGGEVLDTSVGRDPLTYLHGAKNLVPGLEKALEGAAVGAKVNVTVAPEEGYGHRDEKRVRKIPLRRIASENGKIVPGRRYRADLPDGPSGVLVKEVVGDYASVDANHPMAGMTLHFEIEVLGIRESTAEEKAHGHIHEPGAHHHH